jgi:uncharacterized protein YukE
MGRKRAKQNRLKEIRKLREEYGITSPKVIAETLGISERTAYRALKTVRSEARNILADLMNGEFIIEFHNTLRTFKTTVNRCNHALIQLEQNYEINKQLMIQELESIDPSKHIARVQMLQAISDLDTKYHTSKLNYERTIRDTEKLSTDIQSKTEVVWAMDSFIRQNSPQPLKELDKVPAKEIQDLVSEYDKKTEEITQNKADGLVPEQPVPNVITVDETPKVYNDTNKLFLEAQEEDSKEGKKLVP